jgi:hypothetical protein
MKAVVWADTYQVRTMQVSKFPVDIICLVIFLVHLLHIRGWDEDGHVDIHISDKDTAESPSRWCQSSL